MVHGKIKAFLAPQCIDTMLVGETAYFSDTNIVLTLRTLYLDRHTPVIREEQAKRSEEEDEGIDGDLIKIKRVGPGVTENDFVLDFTEYEGEFEIEPLAIAFYAERDIGSCIAFTGLNISLTTHENTSEEQLVDYSRLSLHELELLQIKAIKEEDYHKATTIHRIILEKKD